MVQRRMSTNSEQTVASIQDVPSDALASSCCRQVCPRLYQCQGLKGSRLHSCSRDALLGPIAPERWWMLTWWNFCNVLFSVYDL